MNSKPYKKYLLCTQASGFRKHAAFASLGQKLRVFEPADLSSPSNGFSHPLPFVYALKN